MRESHSLNVKLSMNDDQAHLQSEETDESLVVNDSEQKDSKVDPRDAMTPEHPRFKEVYSQLQEEKASREQIQRELEELKRTMQASNASGEDVYTEDEEKALDRIIKALKVKGKIVTQDDLEEAGRTQTRANTMRQLEGKYDGTNGLPKFDSVEMIEYARRNGFGDNLEAAYRDKHFDAIVEHRAKRAGVSSVDMERPTGGDRAVDTGIDPAKISKMDVNEYGKNRDSIMENFKKSIFNR